MLTRDQLKREWHQWRHARYPTLAGPQNCFRNAELRRRAQEGNERAREFLLKAHADYTPRQCQRIRDELLVLVADFLRSKFPELKDNDNQCVQLIVKVRQQLSSGKPLHGKKFDRLEPEAKLELGNHIKEIMFWDTTGGLGERQIMSVIRPLNRPTRRKTNCGISRI